MNDYVVNKIEQIAISAETPQEALQKVMAGEGAAISANYAATPRPTMTPGPVQQTLSPAQQQVVDALKAASKGGVVK